MAFETADALQEIHDQHTKQHSNAFLPWLIFVENAHWKLPIKKKTCRWIGSRYRFEGAALQLSSFNTVAWLCAFHQHAPFSRENAFEETGSYSIRRCLLTAGAEFGSRYSSQMFASLFVGRSAHDMLAQRDLIQTDTPPDPMCPPVWTSQMSLTTVNLSPPPSQLHFAGG